MTVVGTGDFRYEVVEGWEQLPAGWQHKDVAGVATDSQDRVYLITRARSAGDRLQQGRQLRRGLGRGRVHAAHPRHHRWPGRQRLLRRRRRPLHQEVHQRRQAAADARHGQAVRHRLRRQHRTVDRARRPAVQPPDQPGRGPERRAVRLGWVRQLPGPPLLGRRRADPVVGRSRHRPGQFNLPHGIWVLPGRARAGRRPRERPRPGLQPERRVHHRVAGRPAADPDLLARRRRWSTSASFSGGPGRSRSATARRTRSSRPASASTTRAASSRAASKS